MSANSTHPGFRYSDARWHHQSSAKPVKTKLWFVVMLTVFTPSAGRAALEFSGYLHLANESKFVITDLEGKKSSGWIPIGASFEGYRVEGYDAQKEILTMRKGNTTMALPLKQAHAGNRTRNKPLPPEIARRGITAEDLLIRQDEHARISLALIAETKPVRIRFVSVQLAMGLEHYNWDFAGTLPAGLTRVMLPNFAKVVLSDADLENINRHLALVVPKWLPEDEPNQSAPPSPRRG